MFAHPVQRRAIASLVFAALVSAASISSAKPAVEFDVPAVIAVQVLPPSDLSQTGTDEKLIAIRLPVSTFIAAQQETNLGNIVVSLENPTPSFHVVDFLPKTTLDTRFASPVAVKSTDDRQLGIDFDATGLYKCITGASLVGKFSDAHHQQTEFQLLPPKEVVAASGTIQRGRGVYFKLRPSANDTLEGSKDFFVVARVPANWRGDLVRVRCTADRDRRQPLAERDFLVALHLAGDADAQRYAERFSAAEQRLRRVALEQRNRIEHEAAPKLLQKIGIADPAVPSQWLSQWLFGQSQPAVAARLPKGVREVALQYSAARHELHRLSGTAGTRVVAQARIED